MTASERRVTRARDSLEVTRWQAAKLGSTVDVFSIGELQLAGRAQPCDAAAAVAPDELAVIMYTSGKGVRVCARRAAPGRARARARSRARPGTTGSSKGVMLSHKSCVAMTLSYPTVLDMVTNEDVYIGYLPLAHIMVARAGTSRHTHAHSRPRLRTRTHAHALARTHAHTHTCKHTRTHARTHPRTHTRTHAHERTNARTHAET
jgi:long-subunit acyl-CoA synthetase (AMP-forming)